MNTTSRFLTTLMAVAAVAGVGAALLTGSEPVALAAAEASWLDAGSIAVYRTNTGLEGRCVINNPTGAVMSKRVTFTVSDLDGKEVASGSRNAVLRAGDNSVAIPMGGSIGEDRIPSLVVLCEVGQAGAREKGAKLMVDALAQLETRVVGYRDFLAGSKGALRVVAINHATGEPVNGADVAIALATDAGSTSLYKGKTNSDGTIDALFTLPEQPVQNARVEVTVAAEALGRDTVTQPVNVKEGSKILLTTDKPLYQPGQLIQMRALSLDQANMKPDASTPLLFEVMDSKGNKVFKHSTDTNEFGVAAAEFMLATEVNLGTYTVRAVMGDIQNEKQVTVDRYVLPKFKIDVTADKDFYLPGETLKGEIQADYFFGKPVAGGSATVTASKFEIEFTEFAEVEGTLDDNGHWAFEIQLPDYFAGTPIEQGQASVRLEAVVVDTADHREEKVAMKPVAAAPLIIHAVPEGGELAPGLENRVYVLVARPDGSPAEGAEVSVQGEGVISGTAQADAVGVATVSVKASGPTNLQITAKDKQGQTAMADVPLSVEPGAEGIILRTDQSLYTVGDTIKAEVYGTKPKGTVYFDLVRQGQTVRTETADLKEGRASLSIPLDAGISGSITLSAYMFTPFTNLVRDTRLLYVDPADALAMDIVLDKETYKPGEPASIQFAVTDETGKPTAAALGIAIVDESVFALQEIHPGLEKVYFMLEQEIMKPRYEIHGYELSDIIVGPPQPMPRPVPEGGMLKRESYTPEQQQAARALLASAPTPPTPGIQLNTFEQKRQVAQQALAQRYQKDLERVQNAVMRYMEKNRGKVPRDMLRTLLREKYLRQNEILDPWGNQYEFDFSNIDRGGWFTMTSVGPDRVKGTADDLAPRPELEDGGMLMNGAVRRGGGPGGGVAGGVRMKGMAMDMVEEAVAMPMAAEMAPMPAPPGAPAGQPQPRIREYFPETLLFEPALITDEQGKATITVDLADSITTWRMTTMGSSRAGALGSAETPMRVFQDFFVDLDLPVALTQNDQVSIPVVVYNYLDGDQDVRIKFEEAPWFKLSVPAEQTLRLAPEEVKSVYFPIEVVELGKHKLTVFAYGSDMSDAIRREIDVLPDGEEQNITYSDRLSASVEHTIDIPGNAVEGASKILVRIYPGVFSQIVDGLDSMLQMPFGCFEQTSSVTYPNVLIVEYLKATEQINPEIQMKAEGFINAGYQRLLSYEVDGGGYSWFGDAPANRVLTAWGLKQFIDMAKVHEVDPAVIDRTREWLVNQQQADGSWQPDQNYLHAESWQGIQGSNVLVTAYIADAILAGGNQSPAADKAIDYLRKHVDEAKEAYTLAIVANAFASWNPKDAQTSAVIDRLYEMRKEEKDIVYWEGGTGTVTFTTGDAANVETTALATIAMLNAGKYPETTTKALTYLIQKKSAQGHWGSTQATILALKALMLSLGSRTEEVNANIAITLNGEKVSELEVTPQNSDVMRLVDLGDKTKAGSNQISLELTGEGSMLYQVVGRFYTPWAVRPPEQEPMTIEVEYDKQELAVNDLVTLKATVTNNRPAAAQMVVIDLGIPPGFQVETADLEKLVADKVIDKYEMTGRQVIIYLQQIGANATVELSYQLRAKFPLKAQTPSSRAYEYYNPDIETTAEPVELVVM